MHVDDAVTIILKLLFKKKYKNNYEIFNVGSSSSMSIINIVLLIKKLFNSNTGVRKINNIRRANYDSIININKLIKITNYKPLNSKNSIIKLIKEKYL